MTPAGLMMARRLGYFKAAQTSHIITSLHLTAAGHSSFMTRGKRGRAVRVNGKGYEGSTLTACPVHSGAIPTTARRRM
jgi:hypothetical protein